MKFNQLIQHYEKLTYSEFIYIFLRFSLVPFMFFKTFLPKHGTIVDIGCGAGIFCIIASEENSEKKRIIGIDPDGNKIKIAQKVVNKSIIFRQTSWVDGHGVDCIVLLDVLYLLSPKEQDSLFKRMRCILNKDGRIVINTNFRDGSIQFKLTSLLEFFFVRCLRSTYSQGNKTNYSSFDEFNKIIKKNGYSITLKERKNHFLWYPHDVVILEHNSIR